MAEKKCYEVTVARYGYIWVEAESEEEAMDIADHQYTDSVFWDSGWGPVSAEEDKRDPNFPYIKERAFD